MMINVHIAQNDGNGNLTDKARNIQFEINGEMVIRLEPIDLRGKKCNTENMLIDMHGVTVKHSGRHWWTGNMIWNSYELIPYYALGLLRALQLSKEWSIDEAWTTVWEKWQTGDEITGKDLDLDEDIQPRVVHANQFEIQF